MKINLTYDTETKKVSITRDGVEVKDFRTLEIYPSYMEDDEFHLRLGEEKYEEDEKKKIRVVTRTDTMASVADILTQRFPNKENNNVRYTNL
jgi:hypothetical protein